MTQAEIEKAASEYVDKNSTWAEEDELRELFKLGSEASDQTLKQIGDDYSKKMAAAFLAGAEHAGAKWIKCSERYPDNSSAVLVYVRDGTIYDHCAMYCQAVDYYQFNGQWSHCTDVTHWRPLPLSPEAESK